jgi:hypothetical protein
MLRRELASDTCFISLALFGLTILIVRLAESGVKSTHHINTTYYEEGAVKITIHTLALLM